MEAPAFDLSRPAFEPFTTAQVLDGEVPDLRAVNAYIPPDFPLKIEEGKGTFTGRLAWARRGAITADFQVGGKDASLIYERFRVQGDWACETKLANVDVATGHADITYGKLVLDDMEMREGSRSSERWFGTFEMKRGRLRPGSRVILDGEIDSLMRDGRPLIAFFASKTDLLPSWVQSLVTLQALRARLQFRVGHGFIEVDDLNARGNALEIKGRARKEGEAQRGDLLVSARGQDLGVAVRGDRIELKFPGAAAWYRNQLVDPQW
jgi:hypothetical protein